MSPSSEIEFSLEGTAQPGSILALDDLKVEQNIATGIRAPEFNGVIGITAIYSLSGQKRNQLEKGINIIKQSDGCVKKVLCK
jgi:hypothetical protein